MHDLMTALNNLYIDGHWVTTQGQLPPHQVTNPANGTLLATVCEASVDDVDTAVRSAAASFSKGEWSGLPVRERGDRMRIIAQILLDHREELARIESLDAGKTLREARLDVDDAVSAFRYFANIADLDAGRMVDAGKPQHSQPHWLCSCRRLRIDCRVELPAADHLLETCPGAGRGKHRGHQTQ
ncbi:aldehyde dehydrogenase family protein [Arthrobacter sp. MYb227]|uniref:aldehyde dehydrogenase family protein n=1 Tax=Arthrobacter sp. MYb227 TaxID=1848601 RepID=UPI0021589431|nr:aldehyde dehydrogenase family protein [Arthrobacter sp. MYb227]